MKDTTTAQLASTRPPCKDCFGGYCKCITPCISSASTATATSHTTAAKSSITNFPGPTINESSKHLQHSHSTIIIAITIILAQREKILISTNFSSMALKEAHCKTSNQFYILIVTQTLTSQPYIILWMEVMGHMSFIEYIQTCDIINHFHHITLDVDILV